MTITQKLIIIPSRTLLLGIVALIFSLLLGVLVSTSTYAETCGGVQTALVHCDQPGGTDKIEDTGVWGILLMVINILTAGVGVVALGGLVYGAILYTSAGGKPEQVKKAYTIFTDVVIGIVAFAAMWALLNFIIPGGVF